MRCVTEMSDLLDWSSDATTTEVGCLFIDDEAHLQSRTTEEASTASLRIPPGHDNLLCDGNAKEESTVAELAYNRPPFVVPRIHAPSRYEKNREKHRGYGRKSSLSWRTYQCIVKQCCLKGVAWWSVFRIEETIRRSNWR